MRGPDGRCSPGDDLLALNVINTAQLANVLFALIWGHPPAHPR